MGVITEWLESDPHPVRTVATVAAGLGGTTSGAYNEYKTRTTGESHTDDIVEEGKAAALLSAGGDVATELAEKAYAGSLSEPYNIFGLQDGGAGLEDYGYVSAALIGGDQLGKRGMGWVMDRLGYTEETSE